MNNVSINNESKGDSINEIFLKAARDGDIITVNKLLTEHKDVINARDEVSILLCQCGSRYVSVLVCHCEGLCYYVMITSLVLVWRLCHSFGCLERSC